MRRVPRSVVALMGLVLAAVEARAADRPRVWSVVIGINKYEDTLIPRCTGATRDAKAIADWLAGTLGWSEAGVLRLDDLGKKAHGAAAERSPELYPSRENLDWAVEKWLGERVRPDDVVVIYYAGQAAVRPPLPGSTAGRAYLLPIDARAADVARSGWSLDDALDRAGIAAKVKVVIWLDTSTRGRGQGVSAGEKGSPSGLDWLGALTRWEGVTAWLAADGRPEPEDGAFVTGLRRATGRPEKAHNLMGSLAALRGDKALAARGFRAVGGVGPATSLWSKGVLPVEKVQAEIIVQAGHGDRVTSILVSADGTRVVTASMDSTVRVWKLGEREPAMVRILTDPFIGVRTLALDREGRLLLAGDGSGGIIGWDMAADRPKSIPGPRGHEEPIASLAFLPEGLAFVSLDEVGRSILWDGSGGVIRKVRPFSDEPLIRLAAAAGRPEPGDPAMVAAVSGEGGDALQTYDAQGSVMARFAGPGGRIMALDLSADGRRLAVGDDRGRVQVVDLPGRAVAFRRNYPGPISLVRLSRAEALLVADDQALHLVEPRAGGSDVVLADPGGVTVPGRSERAAFSDDGRWLAACTRTEGRALAWRIDDPARPSPVAIPNHEAPGLTPAFSPDGRMLVLGDQDGGLGAWSLEVRPEGPRAQALAHVRPSRGKVAGLCPSPTGRFLLEVTKDDVALIWDLEQGRDCRPLPGTWSSGAFLPDESRLVMTRGADRGGGDLVVVDREKGIDLPTVFKRPVDVGGKPLSAAFGRAVVSKSGKWVAAAAHEAQLPLACVWEVETGKLVHTARIHDGGLTALDFSGDEAFLLTASDDGTAKLWPLTDPALELRSPAVTLFSRDPADPAVTAARVSPGDARRIATGTRGGQVSLWRWEKGRAGRLGEPTRLGDPIQLNGEVNALTFSPDGRWLAASGANDKAIRFLDVSGEGRPQVVEFKPRLHHAEQVGSLVAWPGGSMIVSGGDDAAIRFWGLKDRALIGTLIAQSRGPKDVDWLAFTPDGRFDGSLRGEPMVKWRVGEKIVTLQQTEDTHYAFKVAAAIARGDKPRAEAPEIKAAGPDLKILAPPADRPIETRVIELTLWSGDPNPPGLRLYHNGVPTRGVDDFHPGETPHFARTRVQLRKGENRLYAMASRPGSVDGKSAEVVLRYDGPEPSGRLHTLALGISDYEKRALKYAHVDARGISAFLGRQGIRGADKPGEQIVLVDREVSPERIDDAFRRLRAAVAGRPEDTVVLFVAGHTDTDERANQFCLLLPRFPFKAAPAPLADAAAPNFLGVAMRGDAGGGGVRINDPHVLPYAFLYNRLARLDALQRLVIVDACQAGAILDDRAVMKIQANVERGSRKARNSYLLAARRGEPANEVDALEHGLLTYTLLAGMGADGLKAIPADLGGFPGPRSADLDKDGVVSSDELVAFADDTLPQLAQMFPKVVLRAGGPLPKPVPGEAPPELERNLRVQSERVSFPLILHP